MNLETVADFGEMPFVCVCCRVLLKFLKMPYYAKQFPLINTFQKLYYALVSALLFVSVVENLVEIAVGKMVNIADEVLSFRYNLVTRNGLSF